MSKVTDLVLITGFSEDTYPNSKSPVKKLNDHLRQNNEIQVNQEDVS